MVARKKQEPQKGQEGKTKLKQLREALGMTQIEFAVAIDVSLGSVANCEQGKSEITFTTGSAKRLHNLMLSRLGVGIESLPDSLKEVSSEPLFLVN